MKYADNTWLSTSGVTTMLAAIMFLIFVVLFFLWLSLSPLEENSNFPDSQQNTAWLQQPRSVSGSKTLMLVREKVLYLNVMLCMQFII